jgi:hypothetical protein
MSNRKKESFEEYSLSTQEKYLHIGYSRFWDEEIEIVLRDGTGQTMRVYLGMMQAIRMADGYLRRGDEAITSLEISRKLNISQKEVGLALRELKKLKVFSQTADNVYYSPRMAALLRKGAKSDEKQTSEFGTLPEGESEKQTSVVKLRLESDQASLGESDSDSNLDLDSNADRKKIDSGSTSVPLSPFAGLTDADLDRVQAKYPAVFAEYYAKFVTCHKQKGTQRVSLKDLYGWCKYLANTTGTGSTAGTTETSAPATTDEEMEEIIIQ